MPFEDAVFVSQKKSWGFPRQFATILSLAMVVACQFHSIRLIFGKHLQSQIARHWST